MVLGRLRHAPIEIREIPVELLEARNAAKKAAASAKAKPKPAPPPETPTLRDQVRAGLLRRRA